MSSYHDNSVNIAIGSIMHSFSERPLNCISRFAIVSFIPCAAVFISTPCNTGISGLGFHACVMIPITVNSFSVIREYFETRTFPLSLKH